jgi:hypothetical protein
MNVWIAGKRIGNKSMILIGTFSSRERAIAACWEEGDFILPMKMDIPTTAMNPKVLDDNIEWPLKKKAD